MKKILGGCLIVLVIALVGFGVAGFYAYRAARPMFDSAAGYVAKARELTRLGETVANKKAFDPPVSGELTASQVERFVAVQGRVRTELGDKWSDIETKSAEIRRKTEGNRELTMAELTSAFSDLASLYIDARRVQVNALNVHKFSDGEYSWVRLRMYEAAGMHIAGGIDLSAFENMARDGAQKSGVTLPDVPMPDVPEANIRLVKPHAGKLKEWLPMAVLGL